MNGVNDLTPEVDTWYPLDFGDSFDTNSSSEFYTIRYEFKPASIDISKPGTLRKRMDTNEVVAEFPNNQSGKDKVVFNGHVEPYKEDQDAVLIFDGRSFRLERLHHAVKLRHVRKADVAAEKISENEMGVLGDRKLNSDFLSGPSIKNIQEESIQINDQMDFIDPQEKDKNDASLKSFNNAPAKKRFSKEESIQNKHSLIDNNHNNDNNNNMNLNNKNYVHNNSKEIENLFSDSPKNDEDDYNNVETDINQVENEEDGDDGELDVGMEIEEALNKSRMEDGEEEEIDICDEDNYVDEFIEYDANGVRNDVGEEEEKKERESHGNGHRNDVQVTAGLKSSSDSESGSESESGNGSDGDESQTSGDVEI